MALDVLFLTEEVIRANGRWLAQRLANCDGRRCNRRRWKRLPCEYVCVRVRAPGSGGDAVATRAKDRLSERLARLEAQVGKLVRARVKVRPGEHTQVLRALRQLQQHTGDLESHTRDLEIQFRRIAQMQAELDEIKRAWEKMPAADRQRRRQAR